MELKKTTKITREQLAKFLRIDPDGLDECLMEQPEVFHRVSEAYALAKAHRDALLLDIEEAEAPASEALRAAWSAKKEPFTETRLKHMMRSEFQDLHRQLLAAGRELDLWNALKTAFEQRSFMLREVVALAISHQYDLGLERGSVKGRADAVRRRTGEERQRQRGL